MKASMASFQADDLAGYHGLIQNITALFANEKHSVMLHILHTVYSN